MRIFRWVAVALAPAAMAAGFALGAGHAHATGTVYETRAVTETVTSPRCITEASVTTRYMQWSTRAGHYVSLPVPKRTVSPPRTRCHA